MFVISHLYLQLMKTEDISTQPIDTEAQILRAAEHEFISKGFAGARTTAIAQAAGVTHGMLHYYFRTKEKLFEKILSEKLSLMKSLMQESIIKSQLTLQERIKRIIEVHFDFLASNPGLPRFFLDEIISKPERLQLLITGLKLYAPEIIRILKQDFDSAVKEGICRPIDLRMLLIDIISLNVFPFLISPLLQEIFPSISEDRKAFIEARKQENFNTIWRKISANPI